MPAITSPIRPSDAPVEPALQHKPDPEPGPIQPLDPLKVAVFPARAFLGLGWIRAGTEKLIDVDWWTGDGLREFLTSQESHQLPFMRLPSEWLFAPLAVPVSLFVMVVQFIIGVCFVTGRRLQAALWAGVALNSVFVLMGAVTPSAFYLVIQLTLLAALGAHVFAPTLVRLGRVLAAAVVAVLLAPFVSTLHPAEVIDDPALMLITVAMLAASVEVLRIPWPTVSIPTLFRDSR